MPKGATVNVLSAPKAGFVIARYNNVEGYIDNQYLVKIVDIPPATGAPVIYKTVKTRFGGGIGIWETVKKTRRLIKVPEGAKVKFIKDENKAWAVVEYKGVKGFADKSYLR